MLRIDGPCQVVLVSAALALSACSSGGGGGDSVAGSGPATGAGDSTRLSVSLIDMPVDNIDEVNVEITAIWIKPTDGPPEQLSLVESPMTVNLLELTDENAALLVDNALIDAGSYEWLAMDVNADVDGVFDSYVVTDSGEWHEIRVPSSRLRLVDGFEAAANQALKLIFDWDVRSGLVYPPGLGGRDQVAYILKPAFRVIGTTEYGRLSGSVSVDTITLEDNACDADDPDFDIGNTVYIFDGLDVIPDDIDGEDPEPLTTVDAVLNEDSTAYEYSTLLTFGDYTVAFTCQAANDASDSSETGNENAEDDTLTFFDPVNVTIDADEPDQVVDF
jgi:hypothetical protein